VILVFVPIFLWGLAVIDLMPAHVGAVDAIESLLPHGTCYLWNPRLLTLHVLSDALIALSYFSIPAMLLWFVARRKDMPFHWLFRMFGMFIVACGATHVMGIWTIWHADFWLDGWIKAYTAGVSIVTAAALYPAIPQALSLRSPKELDALNQQLAASLREKEPLLAQLQQANAELTQLYQKTKELDEFKTRFFANISHELRTPLTLIIGPTDKLLASPSLDDSARRSLTAVARNARLLHRHVEDLLDISKLEAGKITIEEAYADLAHMLRLVAGHFDSLAIEREITFRIEAQPSLFASFDPEKIQRVLLNLLSNAFKFTPQGGRIRCSLRHEPVQGLVEIEVADSGPGIAPEHRELIFERFRQIEGGSARRHGGTGLGLAITRELTALHGGNIAVDDAPEGGARFIISLPLSTTARADSAQAAPGEEFAVIELTKDAVAELTGDGRVAESTPSMPAERPLVLVVEDNPEMNRFICEHLALEFAVESAFDGSSGLRKAQELRPDLVVTDVMMPGMSGDTLVRELSALSDFAQVPIVVLTAKADDQLRVQLLQGGARDCLTKPFFAEELRARIRNLVEAKLAAERSARLYETLQREKATTDVLLAAYERSERVSARFQEAALPPTLPEIDGFRFDAYYQPGPSDSVLGGDWYDALRLADGRIVLSIGDVGGTGLEAAVIMASIRQVIRGVSYINPDPVMILDAAGKILRAEHPDTYVSAFVGVIDPIAMSLTYASAGHPPPLLRHRDGRVEELSDDSVLLGLPVADHHTAKQVSVSAGSLLVLYTDGLTEVTDDISATEAKLRNVVADHHILSADHIANLIHDRVLTNHARDDVAILTVLRLRGDNEERRLSRWTFDAADAVTSQSARAEFSRILRSEGADSEDVSAAEIVFGELVGNVARHAPGPIEVLVDWNAPAPVLHVRDQGPGFSYLPRLPHDPLAESGRGLYIVAMLTDDCNVTRCADRGSHARAVLSLKRNRLAPLHPKAEPEEASATTAVV
jgi:signal transduction histidine kinase/DNA-binding response OmpR family regulator